MHLKVTSTNYRHFVQAAMCYHIPPCYHMSNSSHCLNCHANDIDLIYWVLVVLMVPHRRDNYLAYALTSYRVSCIRFRITHMAISIWESSMCVCVRIWGRAFIRSTFCNLGDYGHQKRLTSSAWCWVFVYSADGCVLQLHEPQLFMSRS